MFKADNLDDAIRANIINEETALALRNFSARQHGTPTASLEQVSWATGAAELLPTFGLLALMVPLSGGLFMTLGWVGAFISAGIAWGLAELLARRRRLVLPSFALFAMFTIFCGLAAFDISLFAAGLPSMTAQNGAVRMSPLSPLCTALGMALASAAYWKRYKLPLAWGCAAFCALSGVMQMARLALPDLPDVAVIIITLAVPVTLLVLAIGWDMSDIRRETQRSQVGFWLHVLAAYELVNRAALFLLGPEGDRHGWAMIDTITTGLVTGEGIGLFLVLIAALGLLAIALDRRSLIITGLLVAGPVTAKAIPAPVAMMAIGAAALAITIGWQRARQVVLRLLPRLVAAQLPRTELKFGRERPVA